MTMNHNALDLKTAKWEHEALFQWVCFMLNVWDLKGLQFCTFANVRMWSYHSKDAGNTEKTYLDQTWHVNLFILQVIFLIIIFRIRN